MSQQFSRIQLKNAGTSDFQPTRADDVALTVNLLSGQTGDAFNVVNSSGTVLAKIDKSGNITGVTQTNTGLLTASAGLVVTGAETVSTTLAVTGATTLTGGITPSSVPTGFSNWQPVAATSGTDTAGANGTQFVTSIFIPVNITIASISYLIGSVGGTDAAVVVLYDSAGLVLANSTLAGSPKGTTVGTAANGQSLALTTPYPAIGPRTYYIGISISGNTAKLRTVPAFTSAGLFAGSVSQTQGVPATIAAPASFTADKAPVVFVSSI